MALYAALGDPADPRLEDCIGPDLAGVAREAWRCYADETAAFEWCDRNGLPVRLAQRLSAIYGAGLSAKMEENPYRLLAFANWDSAERVAAAVGVPALDPRRLVGAVEEVLYRRLDQGHTAVRRAELERLAERRLNHGGAGVGAVAEALDQGALVPDGGDLLLGAGAAVMERFVARRLIAPEPGAQMPLASTLSAAEINDIVDGFDAASAQRLTPSQRQAVAMAISAPVSVLTGGAGTGKTTTLRALFHAADALAIPVVQAAVAGLAARRMEEATGRPASTLLSLFARLRGGASLEDTLVIIDEASMLDLPLAYTLLRLCAPTTRFLFVGDAAQLPPIGFGLVFHRLARSAEVPQVMLATIHRQASATGIPAASAAIRSGDVPEMGQFGGEGTGVSFIDCRTGDILQRLLDLSAAIGDAQILSPLRRGPIGTATINAAFSAVHGSGPRSGRFAAGEPVIWTVNDYDLGLMNGSLGRVAAVSGHGLDVDFGTFAASLSADRMENLDHAYAITVHKSQGSQFERVILPFEASRIADRALIYTAVTRARRQVIVLGDRAAFADAIKAPPRDQLRECGAWG
nr:AAA family ATPase [Mangrovicoccus sp. HB161399]